ncbi:MAG: hypothetical protein WCA16_00460 [Candidatus Sulfotelmatobacter sp.]
MEPRSLNELRARVQGRHLLNDGQAVTVSANYVEQSAINSGLLIGTLLDNRAALIEWKSHVYVLYGAIFNDTRYSSGARAYAVLKLFLLDPRFSDQRREVVFDRASDDWGKVQGMLTLTVTKP